MKRTQLNLDEKTYYQLVSYARSKNSSISEAARNLISKQISDEEPNRNPLLELAKLGEKLKVKAPKDLSTNIDYYLYGEDSPKFGSKKIKR